MRARSSSSSVSGQVAASTRRSRGARPSPGDRGNSLHAEDPPATGRQEASEAESLKRDHDSGPRSGWPATIRGSVPTPALQCDTTADGYTITVRATIDGSSWEQRIAVGPDGVSTTRWADLTQPLTGVTLGPIELSATFNSIAVRAAWDESSDTVSEVLTYARKVGEASWRETGPLWIVRQAGFPPSGYGSILECDAGTEYEVRLQLYGTDGSDRSTWTGSITTRAENIPDASTLVPTHYVRADGDDSNDGLTPQTAWRTLSRANAKAPAGAVVQVGPGFFTGLDAVVNAGTRFSPITWLAQYPALDNHRSAINAGLHTVVEGSCRAGPAGNGAVTEAPWQQVTLTGPVTGQPFTVWRWSGASTKAVYSLGYGPTRDAAPYRALHWKRDTLRLATPAGWAELCATNRTLRHGYYQDGADLFVVLPDGSDPNTRWWTGSVGAALGTSKPDFRVSGIVFRGHYRTIQGVYGADRMIVDHCKFETCGGGIYLRGMAPSTYPTDVLIERNAFQDTGLWSLDQQTAPTAPWDFIKDQIILPDGSLYPTGKVGGFMEGGFVGARSARRLVVRDNTISGFNGIVGWQVDKTFDRHAMSEVDIYRNLIHDTADDPFEPEGYCHDWRIWDNRCERTLTVLSTGPVHLGPIYFWNNVAYRTGKAGLAPDLNGQKTGAAATYFKFSRQSNPRARIIADGNTLWTDERGVSGGDNYASGNALTESFSLTNNIIRTTRYGFSYLPGGGFVERRNQFGCADPIFGMRQIQPGASFDWQRYLDVTGQGEGSCPIDLHDVAELDRQFVDAASGDLRLVPGSRLAGMGQREPSAGQHDHGTVAEIPSVARSD